MNSIVYLNNLTQEDLALVGGKAANLGELLRNGFLVPEGYCISTPAYLEFIAHNHLQDPIMNLVKTVNLSSAGSAETVSSVIRTMFQRSNIPLDLADNIIDAYHQMGDSVAVVVRSSATTEDLSEFSFAGQQETYLNVIGVQSLIEAVREVWASLWTARAIIYRLRNNIPHENIALGVVVQAMVNSASSGVLFTANPLTGRRNEVVIDGVLDLGEGLVSGQAEPDRYVISPEGELNYIRLGAKGYVLHSLNKGGTKSTLEDNRSVQALPDLIIKELANLARQLEQVFKTPQDA